ncbi:MAG: 4'-phosphopantetheinyl transferase superfamily protein [Pseudomonadales bacterium]
MPEPVKPAFVRIAHCSRLDDDLRQRYWQLLDNTERARNQRFRFRADRDRHLLGRALLRVSLAEWLGLEPHALPLAVDEYGKPFLDAACMRGAGNAGEQIDALHFNLSHSGDWVVAALAPWPVGVDVEHTERKNDVLSVARHYFFGAELAELHSFPEQEQRERFFDYWTLKEAYMKARGEGIALGLENFGFRLCGGAAIELTLRPGLDDDPAAWQFACLSPAADYRLALALRSAGWAEVRVEEVLPLRSVRALGWDMKNRAQALADSG